jgi:hypothetical protein
VGWHFPAGGLRRSAAGGPGRRQIPLPAWRLDAADPLASPRAEESSSHGNGLFGCGTNGHACPTEAGASAAVLRLGGHLVHAITAGGLPGSWPGSLIAGQAAAPPGARAAVTPKPPPLPVAGAIQPSAACTQQPGSSEWASAAAKSAGTDREADHICDRGRQCGRHGAGAAGPGGVRADAPGHFRPAAGGPYLTPGGMPRRGQHSRAATGTSRRSMAMRRSTVRFRKGLQVMRFF